MPSDAEILVTCTHAECSLKVRVPLLDLATLKLLYEDDAIPSYDAAEADKAAAPCPACARNGRDGVLVYVADHLRKAPPNELQVIVPLVFDATVSLWKRAAERWTVTGKSADYKPTKVGPAVGVRLGVRPYGGYVLKPGNNDNQPQYGDSPPLTGKVNPRYIRELKHDLLYLAYYGTRERKVSAPLGGVPVFEATTVGAMLALKFDLSFFYGVPTTTDLAQSMVRDDDLRETKLETFSKPIYFDPNLPDNPVRPIAQALIYPLADRLALLQKARKHYDGGLAAHEQSKAADLKPKKAAALRAKALAALRKGMGVLPADVPELDLAAVKDLHGERKARGVEEVLAHAQFEHCRRDPWSFFADGLRLAAALDGAGEKKRVTALAQILTDVAGEEKALKSFQGPIERYRQYADAIADATAEQVEDVRRLIGGLPETFGAYRAELHRYAVVDQATAFYIKAILAELPIGSSSGKLKSPPGRKLVYHMPIGGLPGEPEDMETYANMVIEACESNSAFYVPPLIMLERQKNESGYRATDKVGDLALSADEKKQARVPMVGVDWSNWGRKGKTLTLYAFSELFTHSVGRRQAEHPGYQGPIVHSRGVGGGQVTAPTLVEGVSPPREFIGGYQWVSGIPVPKDGKMPTPGNWMGAKGSIERARDLLIDKFEERKNRRRHCTYGKVPGGKKYDCAACLARFKLDATPELAWMPGGGRASYYCTVDASRWPALFGEPLADDSPEGRCEYPCTWLRAVQLYAGAGPKAYARILKSAREIVAVGKGGASDEVLDDDGNPIDDKEKQKAAKDAAKVMRAAFVRVRKRL